MSSQAESQNGVANQNARDIPQTGQKAESVDDLVEEWNVDSAHEASNKIYEYLNEDRVVQVEEDKIIPKVEVSLRTWQEFREFVNEFLDEPEVRRYSWFMTAREYVTKEGSQEAQLAISVKLDRNSSALDRADFSELDVDVEVAR